MIRPIDILTPFTKSESNRSEIFMVEMEGFLYNRTAAFAISMLENYDRWIATYPQLELFCDMSAIQIYTATMRYDVIDLLTSIIHPEILKSEDETFEIIMDTIIELDESNTYNHTVLPIIAYGLKQIAMENCCEKIIICKERPFTMIDMEYLSLIFEDSINKVQIVSGDYFRIWLDNKDSITTNFVNNMSTIDKIAEYSKENGLPEYINKQLFLIRITDKIVEIDKDLNQARYNCVEHINELEKMKVHVGTIGTDPFPADGADVVIRPSKN